MYSLVNIFLKHISYKSKLPYGHRGHFGCIVNLYLWNSYILIVSFIVVNVPNIILESPIVSQTYTLQDFFQKHTPANKQIRLLLSDYFDNIIQREQKHYNTI